MSISSAVSEAPRQAIFTRDYVLACLANLLYLLNYYVPATPLPLSVVQLGGTESQVGLVAGFFVFSSLIVRMLVGREVDRRAKQVFLLAGCVFGIIATLGYSLSDSIAMILVFRIAHGMGVGLFMTAVLTLVSDVMPQDRRAQAMGYFAIMSSLAIAIGPALGEFIYHAIDGRAAFVLAALLAGGSFIATLFVRAGRTAPTVVDSGSPRFFSRSAVRPSLIAVAMFFSFGTMLSFIPLYVADRGIGTAGLFFSVASAAILLSRLFCGRAADRYGRATLLVPAFVVLAGAMILLWLAHSGLVYMLAAFGFGIALGTVQPLVLALAADRAPVGQRGVGMAMVGGSFDLGAGVGGIVSGITLQLWGYGPVFLLNMACALAGIPLSLVRDRPARVALAKTKVIVR